MNIFLYQRQTSSQIVEYTNYFWIIYYYEPMSYKISHIWTLTSCCFFKLYCSSYNLSYSYFNINWYKFNINWYLHHHYYSVIMINVLLHYKSKTNLVWNFTNSNCDNLNFLLLFILLNSLVDIAILHLILNLVLNWLIEKMNSFATEFILNKINTIISKINYN